MDKLTIGDGSEYLIFNPNNLMYTGLKATQEIGELTLAQEAKIEQLEKENNYLKAELEVINASLKHHGINITDENNTLNELLPNLSQNNPNPYN